MKKLFIKFLVTLVGFLSLSAGASVIVNCQEAVKAFLAHPAKHTFTVLVSEDQARCWSFIEASNSNLALLARSVERGNRWAAEYLARNLRNLDGGNLEDSLTALGKFSDQRMERFLTFANKGQLSQHEFTDALTMLPLSLGDDQQAQLSALKFRRDMLIHVNRADLFEQKASALKAIDGSISQVRATISASQ